MKLIFYKLTESSPELFHTLILPKVELSHSLVLRLYLPLAHRLKWDPQDPKPCIVISKYDTVSLTIIKTTADFSSVFRQRTTSGHRVTSSGTRVNVAVLFLKVTLFPNQGFCIGITSHHSILDVHYDKAMESPLIPEDLTPSFDCTVINVPRRLEAKMMEFLLYLSKDIDNLRSLKPPPADQLSEKLRERAKKDSPRSLLELHLSTFVIGYAYAWTCLVRAHGGHANRPVYLFYVADFRHWFNPQVLATYFGNGVFPTGCFGYEARAFLEEDGFVKAVEILSDLVKRLDSQGIESHLEAYVEGRNKIKQGAQIGTVSGSTQLGVHGLDFGWGRPVETEFVSIDRNEAFSMSERRYEPGGVEMGVCLKMSEIKIFLSLFKNGI
ncbi:unnamed protein product [Thlaspi arvense]|uniref:Uncharacterized protein n=1 Tax=Thlaspi arvense TaxID=13288 RepID=A0AAU9T9F5_THLAR|nr:unnamed protein product [Thlaspi arvense]